MRMNPIVAEDARSVATRLGGLIERFDGQHVLITGGTGFVGLQLLTTILYLNDHRLRTPCTVYLLARRPIRLVRHHPDVVRRADVKVLEGDVREFKKWPSGLGYVIHAASSADPEEIRRNPIHTVDVIVQGTANLLETLPVDNLRSILFLSSGAVYGPQPLDLAAIPESFAGAPGLDGSTSAYGEAKRYAEVLCRIFEAERRLPMRIARLFAFVGPYLDLDSGFGIVEFMRHALVGEPIVIRGDGRAVRTWCYGADMCVALWTVLLAEGTGEVFNVGVDAGTATIEEVARLVARSVDPPVDVRVAGKSGPDTARPRYVPDISLLRRRFGFTPQYDLRTSIDRTLRFHMGNRSPANIADHL